MNAPTKAFDPSQVKEAPSRFRTALGKYRVSRSAKCTVCGLCVDVCPLGVNEKTGGRITSPRDYKCLGPKCPTACFKQCPVQAITVRTDPTFETMGDYRWTGDMLVSTYYMCETGRIPQNGLEYRTGASDGGFDKLRLIFPKDPAQVSPEEVDTSIELNRTGDGRPQIDIPFPVYGGGMSFGSVSIRAIVGRMKAAQALNSFCCTGEGGYPDDLIPYDNHVITQVATGLFGVREETIQRVRIVEFKYAQGAKPGLGGHLLGDKVTPAVAKMREAVVGSALFSPFPFHSVYSVEDHKKHIDWIKATNSKALVSVKVSTPTDVDMVAVGSYFAGAHIIHLDGSYGGTGAAPDIAKKNIAMPIEYAVPMVHRFLVAEGIRDKITLIASGGIRTPHDLIKIVALGADGIVTGTADMVAMECVRCHNCESGRGCARGIATTDTGLVEIMKADWVAQRLINMYQAWRAEVQRILAKMGLKSIRQLVGRTEFLAHLDYLPDHVDGEIEY
ncbi:MAG: FMN-binding glutamate synthase family protein [Deltaproteobacteria bacterium]|nr:FMN-binding glutamate synthase family protein [Deltaproteobacteria bacterium]